MSNRRTAWSILPAIVCAWTVSALLAAGGCASPLTPYQPQPTVSRLMVRNHVGGTHYRTLFVDELWYQTFGPSLLVIDPSTAEVIHTLSFGEVGQCGPATDLAMVGETLFALVHDDELIEISRINPRKPAIGKRWSAAELGLRPQRLVVVDLPGGKELFVCGDDGVLRWNTDELRLRGRGAVESVALSGRGLVATAQRRVYLLANGSYIGSASTLHQPTGWTQREMLFTRRTSNGTLVGLMDENIRELTTGQNVRAVAGEVRSVRYFDDAWWVVGDESVYAYQYVDGALETRRWVDIRGAMDIAPLGENHLIIAGTFGRSIYRLASDSRGPADTFVRVHREASRLDSVVTDGRHVLAGSVQGNWLYLIGSNARLSDAEIEDPKPPLREAASGVARATIGDDSTTLLVEAGGWTYAYRRPDGATLHTVVAVDGDMWIGHERGIDIISMIELPVPLVPADAAKQGEQPPPPSGPIPLVVRDTLRMDGPVRYILPLAQGGGAAFVDQYGGFGTAEYREVPVDEIDEAGL